MTVYAAPRCQFYERVAVEGGFRYEMISVDGPNGAGRLDTPHPPAVGDLIHLWDVLKRQGGTYRVIDRAWHHSSYGSTDWPYAAPVSKEGPLLDIIVESAVGPFVDEAPEPDEEAQDG